MKGLLNEWKFGRVFHGAGDVDQKYEVRVLPCGYIDISGSDPDTHQLVLRLPKCRRNFCVDRDRVGACWRSVFVLKIVDQFLDPDSVLWRKLSAGEKTPDICVRRCIDINGKCRARLRRHSSELVLFEI